MSKIKRVLLWVTVLLGIVDFYSDVGFIISQLTTTLLADEGSAAFQIQASTATSLSAVQVQWIYVNMTLHTLTGVKQSFVYNTTLQNGTIETIPSQDSNWKNAVRYSNSHTLDGKSQGIHAIINYEVEQEQGTYMLRSATMFVIHLDNIDSFTESRKDLSPSNETPDTCASGRCSKTITVQSQEGFVAYLASTRMVILLLVKELFGCVIIVHYMRNRLITSTNSLPLAGDSISGLITFLYCYFASKSYRAALKDAKLNSIDPKWMVAWAVAEIIESFNSLMVVYEGQVQLLVLLALPVPILSLVKMALSVTSLPGKVFLFFSQIVLLFKKKTINNQKQVA